MHTWSEFDPTWSDAGQCQSGEGPLACELRLHNPSVALIRLGANDYGVPELYAQQLRRIVETCLSLGIVPVLGTKPDRLEGPQNTLNGAVQRLAAEEQVPLWDYDLLAATVQGKGLEADGVHFTASPSRDYAVPATLRKADALQDLSALWMLELLRRTVAP
jgi:hypothetical protein